MGAAAFQLARPGRAADNRAVQHPLQTWPLRRPQRLDHLAWPAGLAVAVLGPHPDDFDCIAVTLRHLHQRGARVAVAVLSTGISGVEDADADPPTPAHKAALRRAEQQASCRQFGLPADALAFLPLAEDGEGEPADTPGNAAAGGRRTWPPGARTWCFCPTATTRRAAIARSTPCSGPRWPRTG
jgi:hypothetical protein